MQVDGVHLFWYRQESFTLFDPREGIDSLISSLVKYQFLEKLPANHSKACPSPFISFEKLKELYFEPERDRIKNIPFRSVEKLYHTLFNKVPIVSGLKATGSEPHFFRDILSKCCDKYACTRLDPDIAKVFLSLPSGKMIKHLRKGTCQVPTQPQGKLVPTLLFYVPEKDWMPSIPVWEERHIYPIPLNPIHAALDEEYLIRQVRELMEQKGLIIA